MNGSSLLDLRPLSIAELFDRAFRLYRNNFITFLGIVVLTQLPIYLYQIILAAIEGASADRNSTFLTNQFVGPSIFGAILAAVLGIIFTQVGAAALTKAISDSYLGRKINLGDAFRRIGGTWFTLIFATIVASLVIAGLAIPVVLLANIPCIGFIIGIVGFVYVFAVGSILISLIPPVVVLEKGGVINSIKRAWALGKLRLWWAVGYLLLLALLSLLVIEGPAALLAYLFETMLGDANIFLQTVVQQTASLSLTAVFQPIRLAAITLMYFDLRIRFEGFDLMVLASADEEVAVDASDLTTKTTL